MPFWLDEIVPWGRSYEEYVAMFGLTDADIEGRTILGCGDGPAGFNAEATRRGYRVISCDPVYRFSAAQIEQRVHETYDVIMEHLRPNVDDYVWDTIASPEELGRVRMAAMQCFLEDYKRGKEEGRYLEASLPSLPFPDKTFDLALCSHLLFTYSEHLSLDFHQAAIAEMCRVAKEVRVFPLLDLGGRRSAHLEPVVMGMGKTGYRASLAKVNYEFQKGADTMLSIRYTLGSL